MRPGFFQFHKTAEIHCLTGRMGSGKTTMADKLEGQYDLVIPTDFSKPKQPDGKYLEISRERKNRIREEKLAKILSADVDGKKVLVEGHPPGVVKLFRIIPGHDHLKDVDKVIELDLPLQESFKRVLRRVEQDPDERDTMEEMDSAVDNNKKYDEYLERIRAAGVPIEQVSSMAKEAAKALASPRVLEKVDQHLTPSQAHRWQGFSKSLRSKAFVEAFKNDERATPSQRRSAELRHLHLTAKDKGTKVQGETGRYTVKYHPTVDRYTCSCGDYTYKKSGTSKGTCKHIEQVRQPQQEQPLLFDKVAERVIAYEKQAGLIIRGLQLGALARQGEAARRSGAVAKSVADAYEQNMPDPARSFRPLHMARRTIRDIYHEALPNIQYV